MNIRNEYTISQIVNSATNIIKVSSRLTFKDYWNHFKIRLGIGRHNSKIAVGVYSVGAPNKNSPIFVSSNFKMSFNKLRSDLDGIDSWILVIDTKGINVWCAAGKGTFGTNEIIKKIKEFNVESLIEHKTIILPQLGAAGTSAYIIQKETGLKVIYGPVKSSDIKEFLKRGFKATHEMRMVQFNLKDRIILTPVELIQFGKYFIIGLVYILFLSAISGFQSGFSYSFGRGFYLIYSYAISVLAGSVLTPILLPFIPFRSFSLKGWSLGIFLQAAYLALFKNYFSIYQIVGILFLFPTITAYLSLNFTGATTFTSPSGVRKEIKMFVRPMLACAIIGFILISTGTLKLL